METGEFRNCLISYLSLSLGTQKDISLQRQKLNQYYMPNGAIWLFPVSVFSAEFYGPKTQMYIMPEEVSVDIDTQEDFYRALRYKQRKPQ